VLEEVIVTAKLRQQALQTLPASITVIDAAAIRGRSASHLQDVLNIAPNVNYAGGTATARYYQVRGIGERSQFVDPVDPSVGLVIDNIDLSGLGGAATLFDVDSVEVLRGPQGTAWGASAMAGLVNIRSAAPGETPNGYLDAQYGDYGTWSLGAAAGGPLAGDTLRGRVALQQYRSDGYIDNTHLDRDDTNDRDELTARTRLDWEAGASRVSFTALYADVDNGYDAFSLDNTRETLSDEPGHDRQQTAAAALTWHWDGARAVAVETIYSGDVTDTEYGYDEDWSYVGLCDGTPCEGWEYASTDNYRRDRDGGRLELRLLSKPPGELFGNTSWVAGLYGFGRSEDLTRKFTDFDLEIDNARFDSEYSTRRLAAYAESDTRLGERLSLTLGLRAEGFAGDYDDSYGVDAEPDETLWGGEAALEYLLADDILLYGLVSRGFKAGGVNGEALGRALNNGFAASVVAFLDERLEYDSETLLNYELGLKGRYLDRRLGLRAALFYADREDVQLKGWYNEGPLFVGYTDNAASGSNYGMELEADYALGEGVVLFAGLGLLDTQIEDFAVLGDAGLVDQSGREQAHAPQYQFHAGAQFELGAGVYGRVESEGKDSFYFSDSHDQRSDSFTLLHARLGWRVDTALDIALWGRNLTDEDVQLRGYYFGNDPRNFYENAAYYQFGEPRTYGVQARYSF